MGYLNDRVLDLGVNEVDANGTHLYICSQLPATYAEASDTYALGVKATPAISAPQAAASGRKVVVSAITDGTVTGTGTATHWALVDAVNERLLAAQALSGAQVVTAGNVFTTAAIEITIPAPA